MVLVLVDVVLAAQGPGQRPGEVPAREDAAEVVGEEERVRVLRVCMLYAKPTY